MGSFLVVPALVLGQRGGNGGDGEFADGKGPERQARRVVAAFDAAVPLGAPGRQDVQGRFAFGAAPLDPGRELRAVVDLDRPQGERPVGRDRVEEASGVVRGGARAHPADHEAGDGVGGAELLEGPAVAMDGHVVDWDAFARVPRPGAVLPALGVAVGEARLLRGPARPRSQAAGWTRHTCI